MPQSRTRKPRTQRKAPKRALALPDLEHAKAAVLASLTSASGQRPLESRTGGQHPPGQGGATTRRPLGQLADARTGAPAADAADTDHAPSCAMRPPEPASPGWRRTTYDERVLGRAISRAASWTRSSSSSGTSREYYSTAGAETGRRRTVGERGFALSLGSHTDDVVSASSTSRCARRCVRRVPSDPFAKDAHVIRPVRSS